MKRIFTAIISIVLILQPVLNVSANDELSYDNTTKTMTVSTQNALETTDFNAYEIEHLIISGSISYIPINSFSHREDLKTVKITAPVERIDSLAFYSDRNLCEIDLGKSLKSIGTSVFSGSRITIIEFPEGFETVGESSFYKCFELETVVFPTTIRKIDKWSFYFCDSLKTVTLPEGLEYVGDCAFYKCHSLKHIEFPDSLKYLGGAVFYEDSELGYVYIPDSIEAIEDSAFDGCSSIREIYIPEKCKAIEYAAFSRCDTLLCVHIPENVTEIDSDAFYLTYNAVLFGKGDYLEKFCKENGLKFSSEPSFTDLPRNKWYTPYANYCFGTDIMKGTSLSAFSPDLPLSSDMACLITARLKNIDLSQYKTDGRWYSASRMYAKEHCPELLGKETVSRLDLITTLYALSDNKDISDTELPFSDVALLSPVEINAVKWAYKNKISVGTSDTEFSPYSPLTRGQCAVIAANITLMRQQHR